MEKENRELRERLARVEERALIPPKPKYEDFETAEEYEAAVEAHLTARQQYTRPKAADDSTEPAAPKVALEVQQAGEKVTAAGLALVGQDAFASAVAPAVEAGVFSPEVQLALARTERGAELAMHLGQDADAAARILMAQGDPVAVARELGRMEALLESGAIKLPGPSSAKPEMPPGGDKPPSSQRTKSAEPFEPVKGGRGSADSAPSDKDDFATWRRKRHAQRQAKAG